MNCVAKFTPEPPGDVVTGKERSVSDPGGGSVEVGEEINMSKKASPITVKVGGAAVGGLVDIDIVLVLVPSEVNEARAYVAGARYGTAA